jgi:hypothetical protein
MTERSKQRKIGDATALEEERSHDWNPISYR